MEEDRITAIIIASAIKIHRALGPGLLESAYQNSMHHELTMRGPAVQMEKHLPLVYDGVRTRKGYKIDLLVENRVVVEIKAETAIHPIVISQVQNIPDADRLQGRPDHKLQRALAGKESKG